MTDPLKGFEELAKDLELKSKLSRYTDGACAQAAEDARSIRSLLTSARSSMTQLLRAEFVAGAVWFEKRCDSASLDNVRAEAARRNP